MSRKLGLIGILLVLSAVLGTPAWAQVQTGSIFVKATDEQGASVPGANVTLTSPILPQALTGVTDTTGSYRFPSLGIGSYSVKSLLPASRPSPAKASSCFRARRPPWTSR